MSYQYLIASTVHVAGPVGEELQLRHLETYLVINKDVFTALRSALDRIVRVQVEFIVDGAADTLADGVDAKPGTRVHILRAPRRSR